jgi:hypothetical protein
MWVGSSEAHYILRREENGKFSGFKFQKQWVNVFIINARFVEGKVLVNEEG